VGELVDVTLARVPAGFDFPEPLRLLLEWMERQGNVGRAYNGDLYGDLDGGAGIGTWFGVRGADAAETKVALESWFDHHEEAPMLWPFAETGADGSTAALWLGIDGVTRVVHLGSGSGSMLTCVLAEDAVDFLRLLAIGYPEICWPEDYAAPPVPNPGREVVNTAYRDWVSSTFGVTIPGTALEIVPDPAEMGDETTTDPFCRLVNRLTG
jgi:hypothetical protein